MAIVIEPYTAERVDAVRAFNSRLKAGGCPYTFPERSVSNWLPPGPDETLFENYFLAVEGADVRGAYILKQQPFQVGSEERTVGCLYLPISEGAIDSRYGRVGLQLLQDALRKQPLLYSLGMGGFDQPYPKMLKMAGWHLQAVPFHFLVVKPTAFCRNIIILRRRPLARGVLDFLAVTGLGTVGINSIQAIRRRGPRSQTKGELVREFSVWADGLWQAGRSDYQVAGVRSNAILQRLYPASKEKYLKLRVANGKSEAGWAVLLDTQMCNHKQFGNMRVGSIIDSFAAPGKEHAVISEATEFLSQRGVDLIVTNQSHTKWNQALKATGFWSGPSNFIIAASRGLSAHIGDGTRLHFTRGDGEGPSHL